MKKTRNTRNVAQLGFDGMGNPAQYSLVPNAEDWKKHEVPKTEKPKEGQKPCL